LKVTTCVKTKHSSIFFLAKNKPVESVSVSVSQVASSVLGALQYRIGYINVGKLVKSTFSDL